MSEIGESTEFGLRWEAIGLKTHGKMCREIANDLNVYFATVSHWCKNWETGEYLEDKPRSGIGPQHWIKLRRLFQQILLQKRDNLPGNYPGDSQTMNIKCLTCQYKGICPKNVLLVPTEGPDSKIDRRAWWKPTEILQDTSHWTKEDWSWVVFSSESPYEVYPSEILRIMSSGLQRKEIQKQKISNNSPIPDIDLKQWIYHFILRIWPPWTISN